MASQRRSLRGGGRAEEFGRRNGVPGELVVRIQPTELTALADVSD